MIIFTSAPAAAKPTATAAAKPANPVKHAAPKPKPIPKPKPKAGKILNKSPFELENDIF